MKRILKFFIIIAAICLAPILLFFVLLLAKYILKFAFAILGILFLAVIVGIYIGAFKLIKNAASKEWRKK